MSTNKEITNQESETHPLLPSGEWEGFYCFHHSPDQHKMTFELNFSESKVSGAGIDDVAAFTWKGKYDLEILKLEMTKYYVTHNVYYKGDIDENGIWGTWEIAYDFSKFPPNMVDSIKAAFKNDLTGGFHIWPKKSKNETNSNADEQQTESKKLKEIFIEVFA